ncbi:MAG: NUDIX hydrolase [Clostridia bacterium]|nr:MAG: NUDIX hydrolase [Clostridia bacterium]
MTSSHISDPHAWKVLRKKLILDRPPWLRVYEEDVQLPDGRIIHDYLWADAPAYVAIFGLRPDGLVVAIQEYKFAPNRVVLKVPAGILEQGEEPLAAAKRELLEETGYEATAFRLLAVTHDDGNRGMSIGHHYLATGLRQVAEPDANDLADVTPVLMTPEELRQGLYDGRVGTTGAAASIMFGLCALPERMS